MAPHSIKISKDKALARHHAQLDINALIALLHNVSLKTVSARSIVMELRKHLSTAMSVLTIQLMAQIALTIVKTALLVIIALTQLDWQS